jgi:Sulfotransferase family
MRFGGKQSPADDRELLESRVANLRRRLGAADRKIKALQQSNDALRAGRYEPVPDLGYLFIITYGRTGSTLLQGILCAIPGYLIRGENREAFYRLYQYQSQLVGARESESRRFDPMTPHDAWYGIDTYPDGAAIAGLRALVLNTLLMPEPDTRVIGFKEIRWWHGDWREYLAFLQELFPGARFIINVRNHDAVAASRWWAESSGALDKLVRYETQMDAMAAVLGDAVYRLRYDEWVADPGVLEGLFDWLGEPFDRATVDAIMAVRHST